MNRSKNGQKLLIPNKIMHEFELIESMARALIPKGKLKVIARGLRVMGIPGKGKSLHSGQLPKLRPMTGTRFVQGKQIDEPKKIRKE